MQNIAVNNFDHLKYNIVVQYYAGTYEVPILHHHKLLS